MWGSDIQTDKHLPQSPFRGTTFCIAFYESYLSTGSRHFFLPLLCGWGIFQIVRQRQKNMYCDQLWLTKLARNISKRNGFYIHRIHQLLLASLINYNNSSQQGLVAEYFPNEMKEVYFWSILLSTYQLRQQKWLPSPQSFCTLCGYQLAWENGG